MVGQHAAAAEERNSCVDWSVTRNIILHAARAAAAAYPTDSLRGGGRVQYSLDIECSSAKVSLRRARAHASSSAVRATGPTLDHVILFKVTLDQLWLGYFQLHRCFLRLDDVECTTVPHHAIMWPIMRTAYYIIVCEGRGFLEIDAVNDTQKRRQNE